MATLTSRVMAFLRLSVSSRDFCRSLCVRSRSRRSELKSSRYVTTCEGAWHEGAESTRRGRGHLVAEHAGTGIGRLQPLPTLTQLSAQPLHLGARDHTPSLPPPLRLPRPLTS